MELAANASELAVNGTLAPAREARMSPSRDPLYVVVPITVLYALIFVAGVVGNVVTCVVIRRNKHMHTTTNLYLFSLAVSDLLLLVSGLPQEMYSIWSKHPYVFGEAFCVLRGLAAETSTNATVLTITAFTVERYVAICRPFLSHKMSRLSRALKLLAVVWTVALCCAVPQAAQFGVVFAGTSRAACVVKRHVLAHSFEISTFLFFVAPMLLISVLYALIGLRLRRSNMMRRGSDAGGSRKSASTPRSRSLRSRTSSGGPEGGLARRSTPSAQSCRHQQTAQSSRRVLKMLVAVVTAFFVCWAPFHAQRLVYIYGFSPTSPPSRAVQEAYLVMTYLSGILYYVSTAVNPVLYHIMSRKFREAFKDTLSRCCCGLERGASGGRRTHYSALSRTRAGLRGCSAPPESTDGSGGSRDDNAGRRPTQTHSTICRQSSCHAASQTKCPGDESTKCPGHSGGTKCPGEDGSKCPGVASGSELALQVSGRSPRPTFWQLLRCPPLGKKRPASPLEAFSMLPVPDVDISNSSLRDVERGALEAELAGHLAELRERC